MRTVVRIFSIAFLFLLPAISMAQENTTVNTAFTESQPNTLDPHAARIADEFLVIRNVCEGLTNYDAITLEPIPALAEAWDISEDGLTYTFSLRPGVTFTDGSTLDANDVKYSLDRLSNPDIGTSYTAGLILSFVSGWAEARPATPSVAEGTPTPEPPVRSDGISGVQVVDDLTVQITLSTPVSAFLTRLTLPGAVVIAEGTGEDFSTGPVCTGPYQVIEFVQNDRLVLNANENYWGGAPDAKVINVRVIPEQSSQVIEFEAGSLDIAIAPEADLPRIRLDGDLSEQLVEITALRNFNLRINLNDEKMGDVRIRRALAVAIDRETLINTVLAGQGTAADGLYPPGLSTFDASFDPFPYNPEEARALLAEAGYPDGIELTVRTGQIDTEIRVLNAIAAIVAESGITLNVSSTEASVYTQDRTACTMEMGSIGWGMDYPDPENMVVLLLPNAATRINCGYGDISVAPELAALNQQAVSMPLGEERDAIFREIERIGVGEQIMILPIYHGKITMLVNSRLGTVVDNLGTQRFALIDLN